MSNKLPNFDHVSFYVVELPGADPLRVAMDRMSRFVESFAALPELAGVVAEMRSALASRAKGRNIRTEYRLSYRVPGYPRRTDRLGSNQGEAEKWARFVSEAIGRVKARTQSAEEVHRLVYVDRSGIEQHLVAFEAHIKSGNVKAKYLGTTMQRLRDALELMQVNRVDRLRSAKVSDLLEKLAAREVGKHTGRKLSDQTKNYYLRVLRQFGRWLVKFRGLPRNPFENVDNIKVTKEARRRDASVAEVAAICAYCLANPERGRQAMSGADRAMFYALLYATGLRRGELAKAESSWIQFQEGGAGEIFIPGTMTKNGKPATQPLMAWMVEKLRDWPAMKRPGLLFPDLPRDTIKMFHRDREAARAAWAALAKKPAAIAEREQSAFLAYEAPEGVLVLHSLRHGYSSALLASGADLKLVQTLTRHSTIQLLVDRYGHASENRRSDAVEVAIPSVLAIGKAQRVAQRNTADVSGDKRLIEAQNADAVGAANVENRAELPSDSSESQRAGDGIRTHDVQLGNVTSPKR